MVHTDFKNDINSINQPSPLFGKANFNVNSSPDFSEIKIPQIKDKFDKKEKTAENDGKFSLLEFGKNIVKGTGQFFVDIYKNIIENPVMSLGIIAIAGAMASTPLGLMLLSGGGLMVALFGTGIVAFKSGMHAFDGKWDKLEKEGIEVGKLIMTGVTSAFGAIKASKMLTAASNNANASGKAFSWGGLWKGVKNIPGNIKNAVTKDFWPAAKKAVKLDADLTGSLMWRLLKIPYRAVKKPFLKGDASKNCKVFTLKNNEKKGIYQTFVEKNLNKSRVFTDPEKKYLATFLETGEAKKARLFDWTFSEFRKLGGNFITAARQAGD